MPRKKTPKTTQQITDEEFAPIEKDLTLAHRRIETMGKAPWLLKFAETKLTELSSGQLSDLSYEILTFALPPDPRSASSKSLIDKKIALRVFTGMHRQKDPPYDPHHPQVPLSLILDFQDILKKKFDDFFSGYWEQKKPETVERIICPGVRPPGGTWIAESFGQPSFTNDESLLALAFEVVKQDRERFGICKNCGRHFVAARKRRGKFCSPRCASYNRTMKWRKKGPGKRGR